MNGLRIKTVGLSLSALFASTYALCVLWDMAFPGWAMRQVWQGLFPGFNWSFVGVLIGLVEIVLYSFYAAVVFVLIHNRPHRRELARELMRQWPTYMAHPRK